MLQLMDSFSQLSFQWRIKHMRLLSKLQVSKILEIVRVELNLFLFIQLLILLCTSSIPKKRDTINNDI